MNPIIHIAVLVVLTVVTAYCGYLTINNKD